MPASTWSPADAGLPGRGSGRPGDPSGSSSCRSVASVSVPDADSTSLDLGRVVFFSDCVFAIAMTILALTIRIPAVRSDQVARAIRDLVPQLASYFLSFAVISLFWLGHHRMFSQIRRLDTALIVINLILLSLVALMPFPTELLGRYGNSVPAVVLYAATTAVAGAASAAIWLWAAKGHRLIDPSMPHEMVVHYAARVITVPVVFTLSIPIALVSTSAAEDFWLVVIVLRIVYRRRFGRLLPRPDSAG